MKFTEFTTPALGPYVNRKINIDPVQFQIPKLYMPFGISGFAPEYGQKKWNIDFSIKNWDQDGYNQKFYKFIIDLENHVINHVHANCQQIFQNAISHEGVASMFNSNIKYSPGRDPRFRVKVDTDNEGFIKPLIFNAAEEDITSVADDKLHAHKMGSAIIEIGNIYFMNKRFGITWKLVQLKVFDPFQKASDPCLFGPPPTNVVSSTGCLFN